MIYAQILNGQVVNIIVLNDASLKPVFAAGFDYLIRIDNRIPVPQMGMSYDASTDSFS